MLQKEDRPITLDHPYHEYGKHWIKLSPEVPEKAVKVAEKYWPGPLTMIFNKSDIVPVWNDGEVLIRLLSECR